MSGATLEEVEHVVREYMTSTQWAYLYALAWLEDKPEKHSHGPDEEDYNCPNFKCLLERDPLGAARKAQELYEQFPHKYPVFKNFLSSFKRVTEIEDPPSALEGYSLDVINAVINETDDDFPLVLPGPTTC